MVASRYRCGRCTFDEHGPVLKEGVWKELHSPFLFLCLDCMEHLLGRRIVRDDLKKVPSNGYFGRWINDR